MIRLVQRRLIIPRGDTGTFSVPVLSSYNSGDAAVFSIIDPKTQRRVYNQLMYVTDNVLSVKFEHGDTVNLPVGKFLWDIKFYQDPVIDEGQVVSGKEVDSYYAAFTMPECEVRQTGDNMLTADDAPGSTLTPQHINAISAALFALNEAVEKTETNVTHYPTIIDGEWNVWDANVGDYTTTGIEATGNGIASIEKTNTEGLVDTYTVNFTDGTTFLYDITNGSSISSITKQSTSGLIDTYVIIYTNGNSTTFTVTNGATPNISIGTVQEGSIAAASITGDAANPVLNLTLPNANVPTKVSELENDAGYLTTETDPTVPQWAKAPTKPSYTAQEVGALPDDTFIPTKVSDLQDDSGHYIKPANGIPASDLEETYLTSFTETDPTVPQWAKQSTKPAYTAQEVGALPVDTYIPEKTSDLVNDSNYAVDANYVHTDNNYTTAEKNKLSGIAAGAEVNVNADWNAVSGDAQILNKPTRLSAFLNDEGYLTAETDPTVPAWAKAAQKPTYTAAEVGAPTIQEMNEAIANVNTMKIHICAQGEYDSETGVPTIQNPDTQTFYLVPGGENNNLFIEWVYVNSAWERFGSADVDLSDYVQKTDYATSTTAGVIKVNDYGLQMIDNGDRLALRPATIAQIKGQASNYLPIVPTTQHAAVFYGLATAAGDSSQIISNNEIGTYTNNAKIAIQTMLNVPAKEDVPIKVSDLTNDAGYLTQHQDISGKANSADLAAVATSGNYNDLSNKPSIPTKVSDLTDDSGHYTKPLAGIPASDLASGVIPTVPVQDVQVNGTSIVSDGIANIQKASSNNLGVVGIEPQSGVVITSNGKLEINPASTADIKKGENTNKPIAPFKQDVAAFYGLSKVAGVDLANETVTLGTYPETSKTAIRSMLGATSSNVIAVQDTQPTDPDTKIWLPETAETPVTVPTVAEMNAALAGKVDDVQVNGVSVVSNGVANVPVATSSSLGVVKAISSYGITTLSSGDLTINTATIPHTKSASNSYLPITPAYEHASTFFGLAKAAGADMANISNPIIGTYPDAQKTAIKEMLGVQDGLKVVRLI